MSTLELEHIKHTSSSSNNLSVHSDGSLTLGSLDKVSINTTTGPEALNISGNGNLRFQTTNTVRIEYLNSSGAYALGTTGGAAIGFNRPAAGDDEIFFETHNGGVSHQERMRINKDGYVTTPYQPKFFSYLSGRFPSSGDIPSNSIIPFDSTNQNVGSGFDTSNYRYTAPVSGAYVFGMNVRLVNNNGIRVARAMIRKNGSQMWDLAFVGGSKSPNASDHPSLSGVTIINANANDYFDLQISSELSYAGHLYADPGLRSNFWGYLLG